MRLPTGFRLGPYQILSPLGAGGMGEVYRARDPRLARDVAIKILPEKLSQDREALMRFERETKAIAALSHPIIVSIFDVGSEMGIHYAVTELLEGKTLRARLSEGRLPWPEATEICSALAEGLSAAHSKAITHRDLKPGNIFLTSDGRVKILDFGLARISQPATSEEKTASLDATETGIVLGTAGYMSPEQIRGLPTGPWSDIFSLGCVMYEMISGHRAFAGSTSAELATAILRETPSTAALRNNGAPSELERLVFHCLEKEPEKRFQSARDLAFALKAVSTSIEEPHSEGTTSFDSIAVLPFVNTSHEPDTEYLSDGITESIINSLAQLSKLDVTPRSAVFRYKGQQELDPQALGQKLNVHFLLTGRVFQRGENLVVATELMDVVKGAQLWGDRYNRKLSDIFVLEEEIARRISESLRMKLTGHEDKCLAKRFTESSEAYQLFLKGRHHWIKRTPDSLKKAAEYFRQAIDTDPAYALAYAGLADCYCVLSAYVMIPPREGWAKAKASAAAAVALDPELAEARASWGFIRALADWDWETGLKELQLAAELNPAYWAAPHWHALVLSICGKYAEADERINRAWQLEPLSPVIAFIATVISILARDYDEAVRRGLRGVEIEPHHPLVRLYLGVAYQQRAQHAEAIAQMEIAMQLFGDTSTGMGQLAHAYAVAGNPEEARRLLQKLLDQAQRGAVDYYTVALAHLGLGDIEAAFHWLDQSCSNRGVGSLPMLVKGDPRMDILRPDPRFKSILQRMGL
jgi:eukaryotic-like serine/threonine-protein kinase